MRSWSSWIAIVLGSVFLLAGFWHFHTSGNIAFLTPFLIAGSILLAAGLHAMQASCDAWCYDCGDGGCGCGHCEGCRGGDCCGLCGCEGMPGGTPAEHKH